MRERHNPLGFLLSLIGLVAVAMPQVSPAFTLTTEGKPKATIVVAAAAINADEKDEAHAKTRAAAEDFQRCVRLISGATLAIVPDTQDVQGPAVLIGRSRLTDQQHVDLPSGLTPQRKEEAFVIICKGDTLILAGNDEGPYHGTEYAVYDLLERLGMRWYMPGAFGEYAPSHASLDVPEMNLLRRPDFIQRNWWVHASKEMLDEERRWKIRNKMNPDNMFDPPGDSSVRGFVADKELTKTKPELFGKTFDGNVDPYLPNLSNAEAVKIAADKMKEGFRKRPGLNSIGIAPDDGMPRDFNPQTVLRNQGFFDVGGREGVPTEASISEEWFTFVNEIAREVNKEFPDRIVCTNGYANRTTPPQGITIDPHLGIMFAAIWCDALHPLDDPKSWQSVRQGQMIKQWCKLSPRVWMYEYEDEMLVSALTPVPITRKLARDMPLLKDWGVTGFNDEARSQWAEPGIQTNYLRARLEWDAHADAKQILDDYFTHWYGAAAEPARAFWDALEDAIEGTPLLGHEDRILPYVYTPELMEKLKRSVERAESVAADERSKLHVRADRLIFDHLSHYVAMTAAEFAGNFTEAANQADQMMVVRKQLMAINPFFLLDNENGYESGIGYWGVVARGKYYRKLADLTNGKEGDLIALLPAQSKFSLDPQDEGRFADWYAPASDVSRWETISTTEPFYAQGHMGANGYPYLGAIWYRFDIDVPSSAAGKTVKLYCPVLEAEGWCWVNGGYVGHRKYREPYERPNEIDLDVTGALRPGERNAIVLRVSTGRAAANAAGGLQSRVFLYSPHQK